MYSSGDSSPDETDDEDEIEGEEAIEDEPADVWSFEWYRVAANADAIALLSE